MKLHPVQSQKVNLEVSLVMLLHRFKQQFSRRVMSQVCRDVTESAGRPGQVNMYMTHSTAGPSESG